MSLHHMLRAASQQQAGGASDPYFEYNTLLLTGDGTNGAQNNTFLDSSTNNFTITRNGNTTQGTFSPYGNLWSNYFDGSGDDLRADSNAAFAMGTGNFTFECWLNPANWSATYAPVFTVAATGGLLIAKNGSNFVVRAYGVADQLTYATMPTIGAWTHIVAVRSGTTLSLYYNGVRVATTTNSYNFTQAAIAVGSDREPSVPSYYTGYVSNLRLVKGTAVYDPTQSTITVPTTPLTAVSGTSLLTCQSNRFIDNSSNNFTLTVNGNTSVQRFNPFNPTAPYSTSTIGGSGYFDGTGDYLSIADNAALQPPNGDFTYEIWWYPTSLSGTQELFTKGTGVQIYLDSGAMNCSLSVSNNTTYFISGSFGLPVLNAWNHIAVVRTGNTYYGYLNGARTTLGTSASIPNTGTSNLVIGAYAAGQYPTFGYLSDARFTKSAIYTTSPATIPTAPLTAITNTQLLMNFTNAGIPNAAMMNDLETVGNAQVSTSVKKYGTGSLAFDGTGDALKAPYVSYADLGTGNFTIECWAYFNSLGPSTNEIICFNSTGSGGYAAARIAATSTGALYFLCASAATTWINTSATATSTVSTGSWYHIAAVRNGSSFTLYVNGVSKLTYSSSSALYNANGLTFIGAVNSGGSPVDAINGYIDDLRITKGLARYTANFTPPTAALPTY